MKDNISAADAVSRLLAGNEAYISCVRQFGDISPEIRKKTCECGQSPYAIVVTCSDSRVIPEALFSTGIGELFVIRVAGNVVGSYELGSIEYAAEHLGCRLAVVLGHTHCGAVGAAIKGEAGGYIGSITDEIRRAAGGETDEYKACVRNVMHSASVIKEATAKSSVSLTVAGAVYDIESGKVEFL